MRIGVDVGGTFTDIVILKDNKIIPKKILSRNLATEQSIVCAIQSLTCDTAPDQLLHSTTLVTNMLLENKGAKTGFITSEGMRDILHIGRHQRPLNYAIAQIIPWQHFPPVPRKWRLTVPERISNNGDIITPLDQNAIKNAIKQLVHDGVESIAVGFLHSYNYHQHEQLAGKIVKELAPHIELTLSSTISPRFREFERFLTAALNARIKPAVNNYLKNILNEVVKLWPKLALLVMTSSGGLEKYFLETKSETNNINNSPIKLALSGLAAAGNAFTYIAKQLQLSNCIGIDVGGTSADITVIKDFKLHEAPEEQRSVAGFPMQIPILDLHTIGAGGGSHIYKDEFGELHVGPESAGANPGPACYGLGGELPTITDAALLVGRLPKDLKLAGTMPINMNLAKHAIANTFSITHDQHILTASAEALLLVEANIAYAIRERTIARGLNPQNISLIASGGAGGILACGIADIIGIQKIIVPPHPGLLAAWGLLAAPQEQESTIMVLKNLANINYEDIQRLFLAAKNKIIQYNSNSQSNDQLLNYKASLRYLGQGYEVQLEFTEPPSNTDILINTFHQAHKKEYGFALEEIEIEWVELTAKVTTHVRTFCFPKTKAKKYLNETVRKLTDIWVYNHETNCVQKTAALLINRIDLPTGYQKSGPLIICEDNATTYVAPNWTTTVLPDGYLIITRDTNDQSHH